ncbi:MAG: ElyC/SanA/YdcF family protein, partial [Verrucomicrobiota bacterium]
FLASRENEPQSILLITSSSHMRRAFACFAKVGLEPDTFPTGHRTHRDPKHRDTLASILTPNPKTFTAWSSLFHEWLGMVVYRVRKWV